MVDSIRTRAGLLLSAAAVTTSFLGAQALNAGAPTAATWLALVSFVGLAMATLAILVPHAGLPHELEFTASPTDMIRSYIETDEPSSVAEIYRDCLFTCIAVTTRIGPTSRSWPPAFVSQGYF